MSDTLGSNKLESTVMSHTEKAPATADTELPAEVAAIFAEFTGAKYNKLMRKLDMRLIPIVRILLQVKLA